MLVELFSNREQVQQFANAVGETVEYYETEQCGCWRLIIESRFQRSEAMAKIDALSHRFRLIVHDRGIDGIGPSVFLRPGGNGTHITVSR